VEIVVFEQDRKKSLHGTAEVWVRYRGDELVDLPRVIAGMDDRQGAIMDRVGSKPLAYHPALMEGGDDNPHRYEDWWVFKDTGGQ